MQIKERLAASLGNFLFAKAYFAPFLLAIKVDHSQDGTAIRLYNGTQGFLWLPTHLFKCYLSAKNCV